MVRSDFAYNSAASSNGNPPSDVCMCTIDAPASSDSIACAAISSGSSGASGLRLFLVTPLTATSIMHGVDADMSPPCRAVTHTGRALYRRPEGSHDVWP
ncbi:unannotated protein [freshwater metagenome]|uniref:Unannotated protein n=1 Tax=freshwater metagenome TaxID=449393 RepID=A0A6J7PC53_9ZZZZ